MNASTLLVQGGIVLLLCYLFYLGQIVIHMCVHASLFRSRFLNEALGNVLCSIQLVHFQGWRIAHMMHHLHANTERDPHCVDRSMIPYIASHYFRIARAVWEPKRFFAAVTPPIAIAAAVVTWQASVDRPWRGVAWVFAYWLIPVMVSHCLVAHFNYITHVGLKPGRGHNTRDFNTGLWQLVNRLTFNFYLHAEHHLRPGRMIPVASDRNTTTSEQLAPANRTAVDASAESAKTEHVPVD